MQETIHIRTKDVRLDKEARGSLQDALGIILTCKVAIYEGSNYRDDPDDTALLMVNGFRKHEFLEKLSQSNSGSIEGIWEAIARLSCRDLDLPHRKVTSQYYTNFQQE